MEHVTITDLGNGYKKLVPDECYLLKEKNGERTYTEAVTKKPENFVAIAIE